MTCVTVVGQVVFYASVSEMNDGYPYGVECCMVRCRRDVVDGEARQCLFGLLEDLIGRG